MATQIPETRLRLALARAATLVAPWLMCVSSAFAWDLDSPNGRVQLRVGADPDGSTPLLYSVRFDGHPILSDSAISFRAPGGEPIGGQLLARGEPEFTSRDANWRPVYGERSVVRDHYRQMTLLGDDKQTGQRLRFEFRCYNAGVAFRTTIEPRDAARSVRVVEEHSQFRFTGDHSAWRTTAPQGEYQRVSLSALGGGVERPLVVQAGETAYAAIAEAGLVDYAPMLLRRDPNCRTCLVSQLGGPVEFAGPLKTPWRVVMLGGSPGELLENNDILLNLSEPCALSDTSWIKPGKVLREFSLTTEGALASVDFAAGHNLQYIEFDAGWYGHEYDDASDATTITVDPKRSPGPLDLHRVIAYAKQRDIGIILYVNRRAIERQLDEILPLYKKWGIAGVKYGFVRTGDQESTRWLHEAVRKAAEHRLMVDIHDNYRPTGYSRTYPNLMTQEGVRGDEESPSGQQATTTLFTRYLAGAADFTICYFNSRVNQHWTHGHQLAKAVCTYSPWQFMFWYDLPPARDQSEPKAFGQIVETPELRFFSKVPTVWDDTRVLAGEIGQYAVIARRSGRDWYLGAMNGAEPREVGIPLDFLNDGVTYEAEVYRDDPGLGTRTNIRAEVATANAADVLTWNLLANGGQVARLTPRDTGAEAAHSSDAPSGWKDLFNGENLDGWEANAHPESFSVQDGLLKVHCQRSMSHLFYVGGSADAATFRDFELETVLRSEPSSNSGLFFHTGRELRNNIYLRAGYEVQLCNAEAEKQKTGSLYGVVSLAESPVDETKWYKLRLRVQGQRIQVFINGAQIIDYTEPATPRRESRYKERLLSSSGGAIAIQAHDRNSVYYFKKIRARKL